jgi:hypothetical protein
MCEFNHSASPETGRSARLKASIGPVLLTGALVAGCTSATPPSTSTTTTEASPTSTSQTSTSTSSSTTVTSTVATTSTTVDTEAPELLVLDPEADGVVTIAQYRFSGTTEPGVSLVAAGTYPVGVSDDGAWSIVLVLNRGSNIATFEATDAAGNSTQVRHVVYFNECAADPPRPIPEDPNEATTIKGDIDGDGEIDELTTYKAGGRWHLGVVLAYGWETHSDITELTEPYGNEFVEVNRLVDLGDSLVLARIGPNLVGASLGFFGLDRCRLTPILDENGDVPVLWDGVGGQHAVLTCDSGGVTQVVISRDLNKNYKVTLRQDRYAYTPGTFRWDHLRLPDETLGFGQDAYEEAIDSYEYCYLQ